MTTGGISAEDLRRIVSLFKMSEDASQEGADEHTKHEAANAFVVLLRLLSKYGLSVGDIPELKCRHEQNEAAKVGAKTASAAPAQDRNQPNVLELVQHVLKTYDDIQEHEFIGIALWTLHTHVYSRFQVTPRLALLSPVPGCGKTKTLKLIERLGANPEYHSSITPAALYRAIDNATPMLLLDEGDNAGLKINHVLRAVLNDGWVAGGRRTITVGNEQKSYLLFTPVAIGAIGQLPLPLMQRSIIIRMHTSQRTDLKTIEDLALPEELGRLEALRRLIVEWAQSVTQLDHNPPMPKILRGRSADNWRVLLAVADTFGSTHWSKVAPDAAVAFADGYHDEAAPVALLYDIRTIFRRLNVDRIKSAALAEMLNEMEDGHGIWNAWRGENDDQMPHAISQGEIAMLLRRFDRNLRPKPLFELGSSETRGKTARGYYRDKFDPWWSRYCPEGANDDAGTDNILQLHAKSEPKSE
jgi:hypothetical protein